MVNQIVLLPFRRVARLTVNPTSGTMNSNSTGTIGQAFLNYTIQENTSTSSRSCTVNVNGSTFTIKQNGCTSDFGRATKSVAAAGLTYDLDIDSYSPCSSRSQNNNSWVHLSPNRMVQEVQQYL